ncbi:L,D-transpeptidase [Arenibacter sp. 6A1]|uniref:L,D-transpeptidase n=1 Tax=Arenibacter sp. 6A1 TaxID=2720391 RepID=UPI001F0CE9B7|nr:L,D-transpeptidase [Arenibacter sp. 6A1]
MKHLKIMVIICLCLNTFVSCKVKTILPQETPSVVIEKKALPLAVVPLPEVKAPLSLWTTIPRNISINDYFDYLAGVVAQYDSLVPYPLSEHMLVHANPWIMDTLANTDYYRLMARDSFVYDQNKLIVLRPGDSLLVPDSLQAASLQKSLDHILIDINIPEFKLRIYQDSALKYTFPVRVGQNRRRYLAMAEDTLNIRTRTGKGTIVRIETNPRFYNPVNGKRFYTTRRDDQKRTLMPRIPWIETEINGIRNGQLIHPTTNPKSLGKAYSNGCIGTKEADAWYIYYHAPLGTPIQIRYDLIVKDSLGEEVLLKDIYRRGIRKAQLNLLKGR